MVEISNLIVMVKPNRGVVTRHRRLGLWFLIQCEREALSAAGPAESAASRDESDDDRLVVVNERLK